MTYLPGLFKLARPTTVLSGVLATLLGGYVAGTKQWGMIILAGCVTALVQASANAWNDYLDIDIDRINQPHRVLPSGEVPLDLARQFSLITAGLSLLIAWMINLPVFLITLFANLLLYLYSWKLKSTVLWGNLVVAGISALSVIFGGVAAGNYQPALWLAAIVAVGILGREVLKTIADYDGDLSEDCRTVATVWGKKAARILFVCLAIATVWVMLVPYLLQVYKPIYFIVILIGVIPVMLYVMFRLRLDASGRQIEQLSQLMKYDFLVFFVAVILGTG